MEVGLGLHTNQPAAGWRGGSEEKLKLVSLCRDSQSDFPLKWELRVCICMRALSIWMWHKLVVNGFLCEQQLLMLHPFCGGRVRRHCSVSRLEESIWEQQKCARCSHSSTLMMWWSFSHVQTYAEHFPPVFYITLYISANRECSSGWNCKCASVDLCTVFTDGGREGANIDSTCYLGVLWIS